MSKTEGFYQKLQVQLDDTTSFPADYMYKFIVPTDENQVEEVHHIFKETKASITVKESKTGKYHSVSVVINVSSSEEIISYYKQGGKIKGIISL